MRLWTPKIVADAASEKREDARESVLAALARLDVEQASLHRYGLTLIVANIVERLTGVAKTLPSEQVWGEDVRLNVQRWTVELQERVQDMVAADGRMERLLRGGDDE